MTREELLLALQMFAKNWLAHDGCWFLAAEESLGMDAAIELDTAAWQRFAAAEANRIMTTFGIPPAGGLGALERALGLRQYSLINSQRTEWSQDGTRLRLFMDVCRVQETRRRKGLPDFPSRPSAPWSSRLSPAPWTRVFSTTCLHCPPESPDGKYCGCAILHAGLDGLDADEVLSVPAEFTTQLGLQDLVSPLRLRGMAAMLARIKRQVRDQRG